MYVVGRILNFVVVVACWVISEESSLVAKFYVMCVVVAQLRTVCLFSLDLIGSVHADAIPQFPL